MKTTLSHLQVNVIPGNLGFYRDLAALVGWQTVYGDENMLGAGAGNGASVWFIAGANDAPNDYDGRGMNHIGIGAESQTDVDGVVRWLGERGIDPLFETPRHRPDFAGAPDQTYYQVMFESPDRVLFEVVYTGPKQY